ncbi:hypothetical protein [Martelella sp. FOR1707]
MRSTNGGYWGKSPLLRTSDKARAKQSPNSRPSYDTFLYLRSKLGMLFSQQFGKFYAGVVMGDWDFDLDEYNLVDSGTIQDPVLAYSLEETKFYEDGSLAKGVLREDTLYRGRLYKGGTELLFYRTGVLQAGTLARDETIPMLGASFSFAADTRIVYHVNAMIQSGTLKNHAVVPQPYGLTIGPASVSFHMSGGLAFCRLLNGIAVQIGVSQPVIKANTTVSLFDFDRDGQVSIKQATVTGGFRYLDFEADPATPVSFYRGSSVVKCGPPEGFQVAHATLEQGYIVAAGSYVGLYESGRLNSLTMGEDAVVGELRLLTGEQVALYETGRLRLWVPERQVTVAGETYEAYVPIHFDIEGNVI